MSSITIQLTANLTADPELRFTSAGKAVANLRLAHTPRYLDASNTWRDGETTFFFAEIWGTPAEHVAESLAKGDRVLVMGSLRTQRWTPEGGDATQERTIQKLIVDEIGPSLRYATAKPVKASRAIGAGNDQSDD